MISNTQASDNLGRLFFSANQREQIEQAQQLSSIKKVTTATKAKIPVEVKIPQWLQVNGLVIRKKHDNVIWINGKKDLKQAGVRIEAQNLTGIAISIKLIDQKTHVQLKPGQQLNTRNGNIVENFQRP